MDVNYEECKRLNIPIARAPFAAVGVIYAEPGIELFISLYWNVKRNPQIPTQPEILFMKILEEVKSKDLVEGEEVLWFNRVTRGIFKKRLIPLWVITNKRALVKDYEKDTMIAVPLNACEVVVANLHRKSTWTRVGTFTGYAYGAFGGVITGVSSSRSQSFGDLYFIQGGQVVLKFSGINDPHGVKQLIKTIQKQTAI